MLRPLGRLHTPASPSLPPPTATARFSSGTKYKGALETKQGSLGYSILQ